MALEEILRWAVLGSVWLDAELDLKKSQPKQWDWNFKQNMSVFFWWSFLLGVGSDSLFCEVGRDPRGAHRRFMVVRCLALLVFVFFSVFGHSGKASERTCLAPPGKAMSRKSAHHPESPLEVSGNLCESQATAVSFGATRPSRVGSTYNTDELDVQLVSGRYASERDVLQGLSLQVGRGNSQSKTCALSEQEQTARSYTIQREGERQVEAGWQDGQGRPHRTISLGERASFNTCDWTALANVYSNQTIEPSDCDGRYASSHLRYRGGTCLSAGGEVRQARQAGKALCKSGFSRI